MSEQQTKVHVLALAWQHYSWKLHKQHSISAAAHGIRHFTEHYIIRLQSACDLVLPQFLTWNLEVRLSNYDQ